MHMGWYVTNTRMWYLTSTPVQLVWCSSFQTFAIQVTDSSFQTIQFKNVIRIRDSSGRNKRTGDGNCGTQLVGPLVSVFRLDTLLPKHTSTGQQIDILLASNPKLAACVIPKAAASS